MHHITPEEGQFIQGKGKTPKLIHMLINILYHNIETYQANEI